MTSALPPAGRERRLPMTRSMTGFGRAQEILEGREITVEVRSVNHRYFEYTSRVPRSYAYLEERLKSYVQKRIARGKVDAAVTIVTLDSGDTDVQINHTLARQYLQALRGMGTELGLQDDVTVASLARFTDIFVVRKTAEDADAVWALVERVADKAMDAFVSMRAAEGQRMKDDILSKLVNIETLVGRVEQQSPRTVEAYRARLTARMNEVLADTGVDEGRILQEAALFADRIAVDEETVRLRSHIAQFRTILDSPEAVGRKLDFLVQEMNREANTIGSKAQDVEVAHMVVDLKSEIEKIREQIQNIE